MVHIIENTDPSMVEILPCNQAQRLKDGGTQVVKKFRYCVLIT